MCRLHLSPTQKLSAGTLEAALKGVGFDFRYLGVLQSRVGIDGLDVLEDYARTINNWANVQAIKHTAMQVVTEADKPGARAEQLYPMMLQVQQAQQTATGLRDISEYGSELLADVDAWERGEAVEGLSTGFAALERFFRLEKQRLYLIAARPSMGKTSLAMEIGRNVAKHLQRNNERGCVAVFSAEMSGKSLTLRMAAASAGVNSQRVKNRQAEPGEYEALRHAIRENNDLGIKIDESAAPSPESMYYKLAMMNAVCPVKLVIFDFMELGNPDKKIGRQSQNEEQRVSAIAVGLKNVAKQLDVPVIALSQLSRDVEKRADKLPVLADLRYSGMLEQIADVVVFIMRPEYYLKRNMTCYLDEAHGPAEEGLQHTHGQNVAYVSVAKQRDGSVGIDAMHFTERYTRFADLEIRRTAVDY
jgi:replicative DNA helicase